MTYDRNEYRTRQVKDYISMFYPELKMDFKDAMVLDVGCGPGVVSLSLAPYAKSVVGIDPSGEAIEQARDEAKKRGMANVSFVQISAYDLEPSQLYDVVILSDVLEHVPDKRLLLEKCLNVMAPGGVLYLNTPNKWFPMEPHLHMLFVSWLPKGLASHYASAFGKGRYEGYDLLGYREFRDLLDSFPIIYTFKPQPNPVRRMYRIGNLLVTRAPFMWRFANAFQVIIQKR